MIMTLRSLYPIFNGWITHSSDGSLRLSGKAAGFSPSNEMEQKEDTIEISQKTAMWCHMKTVSVWESVINNKSYNVYHCQLRPQLSRDRWLRLETGGELHQVEGTVCPGLTEGSHAGPPHSGGKRGCSGVRGRPHSPPPWDADSQTNPRVRPGCGGPDHEDIPHSNWQMGSLRGTVCCREGKKEILSGVACGKGSSNPLQRSSPKPSRRSGENYPPCPPEWLTCYIAGDLVHRGCAGVHIRRYIQTGRELCQTHPTPPDLLSRREGGDVCRQG